MTLAYILVACFLGTALSLALAALVAFRVQARFISTLVSYAVGALLGAAFLDILPHLSSTIRTLPHRGLHPVRPAGFLAREAAAVAPPSPPQRRGAGRGRGQMRHAGHDHGRSGWMIIFGDSSTTSPTG